MKFEAELLTTYLNNALRQDEKVLWLYEGAGATTLYLFYSIYGFLFLTVWCVLAGPLILAFVLSGQVFLILFSLPFLMGFVGWFVCVWLLLRRKQFAYAVTDQRVFILNKLWPVGARVMGPDKVQSMERLGAPERGTIKLAGFSMMTFNSLSPEYYVNLFYPAKLVNIPDPARIEKLIYDNVAARIGEMQSEDARGHKANPNRKANLFHGG